MTQMRNTRPKWSDINKLAESINGAEQHLLKRREIFVKISNSDTASEKDRETANSVIEQIDDICTDNKLVVKHIKSVVTEKTRLKPRAGIKESDQDKYLELITKIDSRLAATGAFDEMLLQKLGIALKKGKEEVQS
jgi:uncharacterized protein (UPF0210 family)